MTTTTTSSDVRQANGVIRSRREAVVAEGPDALSFLQGQLSQDIAALAPGEDAWSLVLHPQGKISAWFRITRVSDDRFVLDVDAGWAEEILTRLNRFKLRTKCEITKAPWRSITIVGPGADDVDVAGVEHDVVTTWAGVEVRDVFGADLGSLDTMDTISDDVFEALRIEAGVPKMGAELDDSTIPAAAGIVDRSVSFTKGCYTGQELVARIDSRGNNVPKRLVGIILAGDAVPKAGTTVTSGTDPAGAVGEVTSAARSMLLDSVVALAYVSRTAELGDSVTVMVGDSAVSGEIRALPLVEA
jgi:tRNA-modifying protein YgfZ